MTSMKLLKICFPTIITDNCSNNSNKQPAGLHCKNSNTKITQMLNNRINSKITKINKRNGFTPGVHNMLDLHHFSPLLVCICQKFCWSLQAYQDWKQNTDCKQPINWVFETETMSHVRFLSRKEGKKLTFAWRKQCRTKTSKSSKTGRGTSWMWKCLPIRSVSEASLST